MVQFKAILEKFGQMGEKTGWTYISIPAKIAEKLNPGVKQSFRVKGKLDDLPIEKVALIPMGGGDFILVVNAAMRKGIKKLKGATVNVKLEVDTEPVPLPSEFLECLEDEPAAKQFFHSLPKGHRNYFGKWIDSAKTPPTKAKRIANAINALAKGMGFPEMLRQMKKDSASFL